MDNLRTNVVASEIYGSGDSALKKVYISSESGNRLIVERQYVDSRWLSLKSLLSEVFLPVGYPDSVSGDYAQYQLGDSLQAFFSSLNGSLSTQAILKGVGVGDNTATVASATITWLLKDGSSMVGRIAFAWVQGTQLDCDCKKWRLFADFLNDSAMALDLVSPFFPDYFTLIVCCSGVMKSIVGVAGGATRAALTQHQARRNNMADVSAKDGSQETMVNLVALVFNLSLVPLVFGNTNLVWILFCVFTALHLICNYMAVSAICMETFNLQRYKILLEHFLSLGGELLSVEETNKRESVWVSLPPPVRLHIGCSLAAIANTTQELSFYRNLYQDCKYLLAVTPQSSNRRLDIWIALEAGSDPKTLLEAVYQAILIENEINHDQPQNRKTLASISRLKTADNFDNFFNKVLQSKWDTSHVLFGANEFRFKWM